MCNEIDRRKFIEHFQKRNVKQIYEAAKKRSEELKGGDRDVSGRHKNRGIKV